MYSACEGASLLQGGQRAAEYYHSPGEMKYRTRHPTLETFLQDEEQHLHAQGVLTSRDPEAVQEG